MGWDGLGRDGMGWDGMGWAGTGWDGRIKAPTWKPSECARAASEGGRAWGQTGKLRLRILGAGGRRELKPAFERRVAQQQLPHWYVQRPEQIVIAERVIVVNLDAHLVLCGAPHMLHAALQRVTRRVHAECRNIGCCTSSQKRAGWQPYTAR